MADFIPNKKETTDFNKGVQYQNGDGVQAQTINNLIESQLYTQSLATNTPNSSEANNVGTPSVEIEVVDGTPRLVFKNLKGEQGIQGEAGNSLRLVETSVNLLAEINEWTNFSISNIINSQGLKIGDILLDDKYVDLDGKSYLGIWEISNIDLNSNTVLIYGRGYILIGNDASAITSQKQVDTSVAYVKNVPSTSAPYAQINKIGGMSYKDGNTLRDAKVTEVKSVGANKFDEAKLLNTTGISKNSDGYYYGEAKVLYAAFGALCPTSFKPNTPYTIGLDGYKSDGVTRGMYLIINYTDGTKEELNIWETSSYKNVMTTDGSKTIQSISTSYGTDTVVNYIKNVFIKEGTDTSFAPYTEHTLVIPESVQSLDSYGCGINSSLYNYVDFENKKFNRVVKKITFNGTEGWNTGSNLYYLTVDGMAYADGISNKESEYMSIKYEQLRFSVRDRYATVTDWKTQLQEWYANKTPLEVVYVLDVPTTEDIAIANIIGVEVGGTLTFENEYGYDVPSELEFYLNSNERLSAKEFVGNLKGTAKYSKFAENATGKLLQDLQDRPTHDEFSLDDFMYASDGKFYINSVKFISKKAVQSLVKDEIENYMSTKILGASY